jgi:hypothetical protein
MPRPLPGWSREMIEVFKGGAVSQFILHGNITDLVPHEKQDGRLEYGSLETFLQDVLFAQFDVVLTYDRSSGLQPVRGRERFQRFLSLFDTTNGTAYATQVGAPREARAALELIDRYFLHARNLEALRAGKKLELAEEDRAPRRIAVVVDYAQFIVPRADASQLAYGDGSENLIRLLSWANDPSVTGSNIAICLLTENLNELHRQLVECPYNAKIRIPLPGEQELLDYLGHLRAELPEIDKACDVPFPALAKRLVGLSCVGARNVLALAVQNGKRITPEFVMKMKKGLIERECSELLEFKESAYTLDLVAGLDEAKRWLREDGRLLRAGKAASVPMGYLICGRIGTGKTFLVECWAGELGIPCVVLKNFRDKWQGATEGNLERIFNILHALGQVVVFVDEADQATGKRGGGDNDSGVSGRVYSMLAKEMSDTKNRGRILWVFATSRPDLVEVDLKRQGRLDVHIPLFPPQGDAERTALFKGIAKKLKIDPKELPDIPPGLALGGNELEGVLVRARRQFDLQEEGAAKRPLADVVAEVLRDVRPSAETTRLEFMDLIAVKECTDARFLPEAYRKLRIEDVERRLRDLEALM